MVRPTNNLELTGQGWFGFVGASAGKSMWVVQHLSWLFFWVIASVQENGAVSCIRSILPILTRKSSTFLLNWQIF